jgi:hypothetical protein
MGQEETHAPQQTLFPFHHPASEMITLSTAVLPP